MNETSNTGAWGVVGKFATVITVMGGLLGLWTWYQSPGTELQATAEYGTYRVDPETLETLAKLNTVAEGLNAYRFEDDTPTQELQKLRDEAYETLRVILAKANLGTSDGYIKTNITNTGDLSVKEVALRVSDAHVSLVTFDDDSEKIFKDAPTIELGEIRPNQTIYVYSWTLAPLSSLGTSDDLSLTHATGKGQITVKGERSMAYEFLTSPFALVLLLPLLFLFVTAYESGKREGMKRSGRA